MSVALSNRKYQEWTVPISFSRLVNNQRKTIARKHSWCNELEESTFVSTALTLLLSSEILVCVPYAPPSSTSSSKFIVRKPILSRVKRRNKGKVHLPCRFGCTGTFRCACILKLRPFLVSPRDVFIVLSNFLRRGRQMEVRSYFSKNSNGETSGNEVLLKA